MEMGPKPYNNAVFVQLTSLDRTHILAGYLPHFTNGMKIMDNTKRKLLKLAVVCLICIGLVTILTLIIQSLI